MYLPSIWRSFFGAFRGSHIALTMQYQTVKNGAVFKHYLDVINFRGPSPPDMHGFQSPLLGPSRCLGHCGPYHQLHICDGHRSDQRIPAEEGIAAHSGDA